MFGLTIRGCTKATNPLSNATAAFTVYVDGIKADLLYQGLAPDLIGMYQINFQIPPNATTGNLLIEIVGPDSWNSEAFIPVVAAADPQIP